MYTLWDIYTWGEKKVKLIQRYKLYTHTHTMQCINYIYIDLDSGQSKLYNIATHKWLQDGACVAKSS